MGKTRLIWVDSLKGWLMLLVVMGHAIQYCMNAGECESNYWWNLIYSFHMPAFMALSGFVNFSSTPPPSYEYYLQLCVRRTRQLLVPFLLWSVFKWLVDGSFSLNDLVHITFSSGGFFWFLLVLWVISIIFIIGNVLSKLLSISQDFIEIMIMFVLTLAMIFGEYRIFGFQLISYYFVFYVAGYCFNKYNKLITVNFTIVGLASLVWIFMASFWNMHQLPVFLEEVAFLPKSLLLYAYRFLTALLGIYILLSIAPSFLNNSKWFNVLFVHIGKISLGLYVVHLVLIIHLAECLKVLLPSTPLVVLILVCFFLTCCMAVPVVEILLCFKFTSKILLGKL